MLKKFKLLKKEESGQVIVLFVLLLVVLCGVAALVIDVGRVALEKQQLKNAIDAACLASAQDLPDTVAAKATAYRYIELNGCQDSDISEPVFSDSDHTINITGSKQVDYTFAKVLGFNSTTVHPSAAATKQQGSSLPPVFGYTIFYGDPTGTLSIGSSNATITGNIHSNGNVNVTGNNCTINGTGEGKNEFRVGGNNFNITGACRASSIPVTGNLPNIPTKIFSPAPFIDMTDISGNFISQITQALDNIPNYPSGMNIPGNNINIAAGPIWVIGNATLSGNNMNVPSSMYVEGDVNISGNNFNGTGSILATGNIKLGGNNLTNNSGNAVLFYSKNGNIDLTGSTANLRCVLYAPNGIIKIDGSNATVNGRVIGKSVLVTSAQNLIVAITSGTEELLSFAAITESSVKLTK